MIDINGFAGHLTTHNSGWSKGQLVGILTTAVECVRELLLNGYAVNLGSLGKFSISLSSKGADNYEDFVASSNIKKVCAKWTPSAELKNLKNESSFERVLTREAEADAKKDIYGA